MSEIEDNENELQQNSDADALHSTTSNREVSSTFLPDVLHRLGLSPRNDEATTSYPESSLSEVRAALRSEDWRVRVAAVRALGQLGEEEEIWKRGTNAGSEGSSNGGRRFYAIPGPLLISALDDEDATVRAAAVHVLGGLGKRAPLHHLIAALNDTDWHVRETAVLALAKQGDRVPREVIMMALHDTDSSVREATELALQWHTSGEKQDASRSNYGKLWEYKTMQEIEHDNDVNTQDRERDSVPQAPSNGSSIYDREPGRARVLREHAAPFITQVSAAQEYAPHSALAQEYATQAQETASYGYADERPGPIGERSMSIGKVTSLPPRRSNTGWWVALVLTAIISFMLGIGATMGVISIRAFPGPLNRMEFATGKPIEPAAPNKDLGSEAIPYKFFMQPQNRQTMQDAVSKTLHLGIDDIKTQFKQGHSLEEIAAQQGVTPQALQKVEQETLGQILNDGVKSGQITQPQADTTLISFDNDPKIHEYTMSLLLGMTDG